MKIVVGSEHAGAEYRAQLVRDLRDRGMDVTEICENKILQGYPAVAEAAARLVTAGKAELGILICGTGIGMCMAAGKVPGIRAALCTDSYMGKMARRHNNANMLVFGSRVIGYANMMDILDTFLTETYEGGRHDARLAALREVESRYSKQ